MHRIKVIFRVTVFTIFALILHYALPQHDIVRVVNTYQERQDLDDWTRIFWADSSGTQNGVPVTRDVQFIQTVKQRTMLLGFIPRDATEIMVYRNEDTGWSWPFYFKFDTANLQTEANDLVSTAEAPKWAVVTHYGWRNEYVSAFPNAVSIRPVASPDVTIIPWFNIVFFIVLMVALAFVRAMWRQFRERSVDPLLDAAEHEIDEMQAGVAKSQGRIKRWFAGLSGKDQG
ncbi:MAG: DUF1523 family protein [Yoonia sp.]|uniref:DUF1523 family protein n=1 Tax=Yoonia sp. TaxID=2212373 RepID=UPI003EF7D608